MAADDRAIKIGEKTYYARGSTTSGVFFSPLFDDVESFKSWLGSDPVFEYVGFDLSEDDFSRTKQTLSKLAQGMVSSFEEMGSLRKIVALNDKLREPKVDEGELKVKLAEVGLVEDFDKTYSSNPYDFLSSFYEYPRDMSGEYLKLAGWAVGEQLAATGILTSDFREVYERNAKIEVENPQGKSP